MFNLQNKVALITGGSRGIGSAVCKVLSANGAFIYIGYKQNTELANNTLEQVKNSGGNGSIIKFDVSNPHEVKETFSLIKKEKDKIDICVNCAGITIDKLLLQTTEEEIHSQINTNLLGTIYCCKESARYMLRQRNGRIINISSIIGETGNIGQTIYSATKAGIIGFSKSLARELGSRNITVNVISPGLIKTDMTANLPDEYIESIKNNSSLKRLANPEEIANAVLFLASNESAGITGEVIRINAGIYM